MNRARRLLIATAASVIAAFAAAPGAFAAGDYVLRADTINGDGPPISSATINVTSFVFNIENAGAGKFSELTVEKAMDPTTPQFFDRAARGVPIQSMGLSVRQSGTAEAPFLRYCFLNVFVTKQEQTGAKGDDPQEKLTFKFTAMKQSFMRPSSPSITFASWSMALNKPLSDPLPGACAP
jgi:type VI protein secretion system component Hcp